jgi:hypothetical protein
MIMNLNTDGNIAGDQEPAQQKRAVGRNSREHFCEQITRVEIRLSDDNRDKKSGTEDERCLMAQSDRPETGDSEPSR